MYLIEIPDEDLPIIERNVIESTKLMLAIYEIKFDIDEKDILLNVASMFVKALKEDLKKHLPFPDCQHKVIISFDTDSDDSFEITLPLDNTISLEDTLPLEKVQESLDLIAKNK